MKFKELAIPTLAAASFIANIADIAESFDGISHLSPVTSITLNTEKEILALPNCIPEKTDDSEEQLEPKIFQCGYIHYNYQIITCFILAHDEKHALSMAERFKVLLDKGNKYKESGDWKMHLHEESKSPEEILQIATTAQVVYTLTAGEKIGV